MNFRKSSKGGVGSFSIQKFMLQIFAIIDDTSVMNFRKNLQHNFPKMRGGRGVKGRLELFRKFTRFGSISLLWSGLVWSGLVWSKCALCKPYQYLGRFNQRSRVIIFHDTSWWRAGGPGRVTLKSFFSRNVLSLSDLVRFSDPLP